MTRVKIVPELSQSANNPRPPTVFVSTAPECPSSRGTLLITGTDDTDARSWRTEPNIPTDLAHLVGEHERNVDGANLLIVPQVACASDPESTLITLSYNRRDPD
jgi:hypothetical protein